MSIDLLVKDIYNYIDSVAPFSSALSFDNVGLLVGDSNASVSKILCCLDITKESVEEAKKIGAELIVSHHPVIFDPLKSVLSGSVVYDLCRNGISAICAHTNLDAATGGVNDVLCSAIELKNIEIWEPENIGRIGYTDISLGDLVALTARKLGINSVNYIDCGKLCNKVAVIGGSGGSYIDYAIDSGADTLITGEMKHDQYIYAKNKGLNVIVAGHFDTEYLVIPVLSTMISERFNTVHVSVFRESAYKTYTA